MSTIKRRFEQVTAQISDAESAFGRKSGSVQLLAVSKTKPATDIALAYQTGQRHFAESYIQEALKKQAELGAYNITWHFIGPIQSNKTKYIATHFSWVHSVDRLKIAKRLSEQRPVELPALNVCIQVNISVESTKSGVTLDQLPALIREISDLPNLRLRGVMAIPEPETDFQAQRWPYQRIYQAIKQLEQPVLDTFSFGMTADLNAAIAEGSTIVRIGTALFGARTVQ